MSTGTLQIRAISGHSGPVPGAGVQREEDVCKYIDVMFVYGRDFDRDPQYGWARTILEPENTDPSRKASFLLETAKRHEKEVPADG